MSVYRRTCHSSEPRRPRSRSIDSRKRELYCARNDTKELSSPGWFYRLFSAACGTRLGFDTKELFAETQRPRDRRFFFPSFFFFVSGKAVPDFRRGFDCHERMSPLIVRRQIETETTRGEGNFEAITRVSFHLREVRKNRSD